MFNIPEWATLFTMIFLHADIYHFVGNMIFWWVFADNIEYAFGRARFIFFIIIAALVSSFVPIFLNLNSGGFHLGASGVISAIMGAYCILYPKARITLGSLCIIYPVKIGEMSAFWLLLIWFIGDYIYCFIGAAGVSYEAHVAGFIVGAALAKVLRVNYCSYDLEFNNAAHCRRNAKESLDTFNC